jgi:hypothetical protein
MMNREVDATATGAGSVIGAGRSFVSFVAIANYLVDAEPEGGVGIGATCGPSNVWSICIVGENAVSRRIMEIGSGRGDSNVDNITITSTMVDVTATTGSGIGTGVEKEQWSNGH